MDKATSGSYIINDKDVDKFTSQELAVFRRHDIGFVFQFYNLMPNLTALENVELAASVALESLDSEDIINQVGLKERKNSFPSQMSGGEQQRVAIARAVTKNPTLLLCDEPTGALDSKTGEQILTLLHDVSVQYNKTVIIVTHNSNIAECASRVIKISDGKIIEDKINDKPKKPSEIEW